MVFLIQNSQNRDAEAIHLNLDERRAWGYVHGMSNHELIILTMRSRSILGPRRLHSILPRRAGTTGIGGRSGPRPAAMLRPRSQWRTECTEADIAADSRCESAV